MHTLLRRNREKSVARYPGKIRGGQVDFSKRSSLLFLPNFLQITFLQIHLKRIPKQKIIIKRHSKTKTWQNILDRIHVGKFNFLYTEVILKLRFSKKTTKKLTIPPSYSLWRLPLYNLHSKSFVLNSMKVEWK